MSGITQRYQKYVGSFFGLLLSWLGVLTITAGVVVVCKGLQLFSAQSAQLIFWGKIALLGSAVIYGAIMFAMTWSFARSVGLFYLSALAYSVWSIIPLLNLAPMGILVVYLKHQTKKGIIAPESLPKQEGSALIPNEFE